LPSSSSSSSSSFVVLLLTSILAVAAAASHVRGTDAAANHEQAPVVYGTQCSFGITSPTLDGCVPTLLQERQTFYNHYMKGCYDHYNYQMCQAEEVSRLEMNQRQPQSMINMTATGYHKLKAPPSLIALLTNFYEENKHNKEEEDWGDGSIYANHWAAPTYMISVEDDGLPGGGQTLKDAIWEAAVAGIEQWTGGVAKLRPVSLYGIREYTEGSVLSPHVDRVPLVSSGIVNVAQDVDEPWPLEVYDRQGQAVNITMEPGDMILYESHSLIHGRPFPLRGRSYANIFIHFEPFAGWDTARGDTTVALGAATSGDLPPYIIPGSPEDLYYREENPNGWSKAFADGDEPPVSMYASEGNLSKLQELAKVDPRLMHYADENGWTPLHEAVRSGHVDVVQFLIDAGAGINDHTAVRGIFVVVVSMIPHVLLLCF